MQHQITPTLTESALRGLACKCPRCGEGKLYAGFLELRPNCEVCGLDFAFIDSGDGPAIFIIMLAGAIVHSRHDDNAAVEFYKQAVAAEDALSYSEPPAWYPPVRPSLGKLLLSLNQAAEAEKIFREDIERKPRDARALSGLRDSLRAQGRDYEAEQIDQQFRAVWKVAMAR